jgi:hypothetical protein
VQQKRLEAMLSLRLVATFAPSGLLLSALLLLVRLDCRPPQLSLEPLDILSPWTARTITAVSPRSGR